LFTIAKNATFGNIIIEIFWKKNRVGNQGQGPGTDAPEISYVRSRDVRDWGINPGRKSRQATESEGEAFRTV